MSILRQLLLSITIAIALLLLGSQVLSINAARGYFDQQLQAQSETGAAMLASAFSRDAGDWRGLAADVFAQGSYALVRVEGKSDNTRFEYRKKNQDGDTPGWFASIMAFDAKPVTRRFITPSGTSGVVTVVADDTTAWSALWRNCLGLAMVVAVAGICWIIFAIAQVRWLQRRLLHEISVQVRALGRGQSSPDTLPAVRELADVAHALAEARDHFRVTAEENSARIESMQLELNLDAVTRLPNRKYFFNELRRALNGAREDAGTPDGHVLMFRQRDLTEINRHMPRDFTDQWLRSLAHRLDQQVGRQHVPALLLARLNGSDFALLLHGVPASQVTLVVDKLRHELRALRLSLGEQRWCRWALAMAPYAQGDQASDLLSRLDHALMRAESADTDTVVSAELAGAAEGTGEHQWRDTLIAALDQHRFSLSTQMLHAPDGSAFRTEATLTLHDADMPTPVPAHVFMPAAVRLGLSAECDIQAVRLGLDWLVSRPGHLVIRLALPSLGQPNFLPRLGQMLRDRPPQTARMMLEIDAHGLVENYASVRSLCEVATDAGARLGIRRLAQDFSAMTRLHQLPIAYLKLGGDFVGGMAQSPGSRQLATSVVETARVLKIDVYAEDVPDEKTRTMLREIGIISLPYGDDRV
jgi:diguanylate cyclase (GGDEF)-like protein